MSRRLVSWVRPERISSPMIITAAVTLSLSDMLAFPRRFSGLAGRFWTLTLQSRHRPRMLLPQPMAHGRLVQRYKRFFADVLVDDGREITTHCPNPGAMLG